jgi:hypothetical protein
MAQDDTDLPLGDEKEEFIPAVYARNEDDAEKYCALLEDHDIPVMVGRETEEDSGARSSSISRSVPILVPEAFLDEASEIIADSEDTQGFLDDDEEFEDEDDDDEEFDFADNIDDDDDLEDEEKEGFMGFDDDDDDVDFDDLDEDDFEEEEEI